MSYKPLLATFVVFVLAGCGSGSGSSESDSSAAENAAAAAAEQAGIPDGAGEVLVISKRNYTSGSARAKVTGFFEVDGTSELNKPASPTDDGHTWSQCGVSGAPELNMLFTNSEDMAEHGVTLGLGPYIVTSTSTSGECRTKFDVKPAMITGHYSCNGSTDYNYKTG